MSFRAEMSFCAGNDAVEETAKGEKKDKHP